MEGPSPNLESLRRQIDEIDDLIHDQLMRRAALISDIAAEKRKAAGAGKQSPNYIQVGREAIMLRRRLKRHQGLLPAAAIARIWREMIGAFAQLQQPMKVMVQAPSKSVGYWDLARNHFGSIATMSLHVSAQRILQALSQDVHAIGILTIPEDDEPAPWWPHLASAEQAVRVVARLPFFASASGQFEELSAFVVAAFEAQSSGEDVSLLAVETVELSRARLLELLADAGLVGRLTALHAPAGGAERWHLVEIDEFVDRNDARLKALKQSGEDTINQVAVVGVYAKPLGRLD